MVVGVARLTLYLPEARSLKDKRAVVRRVVDRLKRRNVSASEVEAQGVRQHGEIGLALVAGSRALAESLLDSAVRDAEEASGLKTLDITTEFYDW